MYHLNNKLLFAVVHLNMKVVGIAEKKNNQQSGGGHVIFFLQRLHDPILSFNISMR